MKKSYFVISEKEYNGEWPFTKKRVMIHRDGFALYVRVGHKKYNLNGVAKKGRVLNEIWKIRKGCEYRVPITSFMKHCMEKLT